MTPEVLAKLNGAGLQIGTGQLPSEVVDPNSSG
jgi:hypothetical protein